MASKLLSGGRAEQAYFWTDDRTGERCKCKADYVNDSIIDLKTCVSASPGAFAKACADYKYHWQHAWYSRGIGIDDFIFIALEKKSNVVEVYQLDDVAVELGMRQIDAALDKYILCRDFDDWPGYNDPNAVTQLSLPAWAMRG